MSCYKILTNVRLEVLGLVEGGEALGRTLMTVWY